MAVKPGYTTTDVGCIPEGWEVRPIGQVAPLQRGFDLPTKEVIPGPYPVVYSNGVEAFHNRFMVKGPGVVTGRSGTLGRVHYVEEDFWPHNTSLWVTRFESAAPKFVYYLYVSLHFERFASGSGVPTLNRNDAHTFRVALPSSEIEQRAIASALSDVDALLAGLDHLIAKKRDLKQATMQQLLTGQTRLPGFEGEWEVKRLGDSIEKIVGGGTPSRSNPSYWGNDVLWATVKDFATFSPCATQESITWAGVLSSATHVIPAGTLITSTRMALGRAVVYEVDVAINQDLKALFLRPNASVRFLYYWFEYQERRIDKLGSGSTVKGISINELRNLPFPDIAFAEQAEIASVLSDMDAELDALEARRDKTRALKQAMMQELLTGRTRLV
jgi:type I restriction enzyme S subunit